MCVGGVTLVAQQQQPAFRGGADVVSLYVTVTYTNSEQVVPGLTAADFEIRDNDTVRPVTQFSAERLPVTATLLLDMTDSADEIVWLQVAGEAFVAALQPGDRARVGSFGDEIAISPMLTGDRGYLLYVLHEELWPSWSAPLWRAIDRGMTSLAGERGRRVIILYSNGWNRERDDAPSVRPLDLSRRAQREGYTIYAVTAAREYDYQFTTLVTSTGGRTIHVPDMSKVVGGFSSIMSELASHYTLGFVPATLDGKVHTIKVTVNRPGVIARTRTRYEATVPK
jgi:VWFA-related protein